MSASEFVSGLFGLEGRTALVAGASSGIGRHFAMTLARAGARVAVAARRTDRLEELVAEIREAGAEALPVALDVRDPASVSACLDQVCEKLHVPDIVVSCAGLTRAAPALEVAEADWSEIIDTNLSGSWRVARESARRMVAAGRGGSIVMVGSILGLQVSKGVAPYPVSKAGLIQATRALALELARHHIRVNAILPGYITTDLNRGFLESEAGLRLQKQVPSRRFGSLEDLDGALLLLASPAGSHMTGSQLVVDGGHLVTSY